MSYVEFGIIGIDERGRGEQAALCPKCSPTRKPEHRNVKCLSVNAEKGVWRCNHCEWSGGLKQHDAFARFRTEPIAHRSVAPTEEIYSYFRSRGISKVTLDACKVTQERRYFAETAKEETAICFNYFVGETLVNIKYRSLAKNFAQVKDGGKTFYKLNDIGKDVVITEGEIDALSFYEAGIKCAVSVPGGGINPTASIVKKLDFLEHCSGLFDKVQRIFLALDDDAVGLRLMEELARRFGKERCWVVKFPNGCKDANDVLKAHGKTALVECLKKAELYPIEGVIYANSRLPHLLDLHEYGFPDGAKTGFRQFDEHFSFHAGQLTIVTGIPSHGKSNFIDQIMVRLIERHGWKFGLFSPENSSVEIHLIRLTEMITGKPFLHSYNNRMTADEARAATQLVNDNVFYIQPVNETYELDRILDLARRLVLKHGIKCLILDPWNTLEHQIEKGENETIYIGKTLNRFKYFARTHGIHFILIAHPRKMAKQKDSRLFEVPTLYDISGSANWYNIADNGIVVYRQFNEEMTSSYTAVHIQKVKHKFIGSIGFSKFNFESSCQRYYERGDAEQEERFPVQISGNWGG